MLSHLLPAAAGCCPPSLQMPSPSSLSPKLASDAVSLLSSEQQGAKKTSLKISKICLSFNEEIRTLMYLCYKCFSAVSFNSHGKVEPCPCIVMVFQARENQIQVLPVDTVLFTLRETNISQANTRLKGICSLNGYSLSAF